MFPTLLSSDGLSRNDEDKRPVPLIFILLFWIYSFTIFAPQMCRCSWCSLVQRTAASCQSPAQLLLHCYPPDCLWVGCHGESSGASPVNTLFGGMGGCSDVGLMAFVYSCPVWVNARMSECFPSAPKPQMKFSADFDDWSRFVFSHPVASNGAWMQKDAIKAITFEHVPRISIHLFLIWNTHSIKSHYLRSFY